MKKRLVSILLASAMAVNMVTVPVMGADITEDITTETVTEEIQTEENVIPEIKEIQTEENVIPEIVSENTPLAETVEQALDSLFPGLPEDYVLTEEQLEEKAELQEHLSESTPDINDIESPAEALATLTDDADSYIPGELVYITETPGSNEVECDPAGYEEAKTIADAFGGTLSSYSYGVATITLPEGVTTAQAITAAADKNINLPAAWPNVYFELEDTDSATNSNLYGDMSAYLTAQDPFLSDTNSNYQYYHKFINSQAAWEAGYTGKGVRIAVIDTGCVEHDDLKNNLIPGTDITDNNKTSNVDANGHGTLVTGIIASESNAIGGCGVAPEARIKCFNVFGSAGKATADNMIKGIRAAVSEGFDVINMSQGLYSYYPAMDESITDAYNSGVLVFASAGNDSSDGYHYPSSCAKAVGIGALDKSGAKAYFSHFGDSVDFAFPGVAIASCSAAGSGTYSGYTSESGTSVATPIATGVAALIIQKLGGGRSRARADKVLSIMSSAAVSSSSSGMGQGYVSLTKALDIKADTDVLPTPQITTDITCGKGNVYTSISVNATIKIPYSASQRIIYTLDGEDPKITRGNVSYGDYLPMILKDGELEGNLLITGKSSQTMKLAVYDFEKGVMSDIIKKVFNLRPAATSISVYPANYTATVRRNGSLQMKAIFVPSYTYDKSIKWTIDEDAKDEGIRIEKYTGKITIGPKTAEGTYTITATVRDEFGSYNGPQATCDIEVIKGKSEITSITTKKTSKKINLNDNTVSLDEYIYINKKPMDAGDVIWSSSKKSVATVDAATGIITPVKPGKTTITAMVDDGTRRNVKISVQITKSVDLVEITTAPATAVAGRTATFKAKAYPLDATNRSLKWSCDIPKKYRTIVSGKLYVYPNCPEGTYTITATSKSDETKFAKATFNVTKGYITSIKLDKTELNLFTTTVTADTPTRYTLVPTIKGKKDYDETAIKFYSSNTRVASVDEKTGLVTAIANGSATITCKSTDGTGKTSTCKVNVVNPTTKVYISTSTGYNGMAGSSGEKIYAAKGGSVKFTAKCASSYSTVKTSGVTWKVSDENKATIDKEGNLSVKDTASGTVDVTAEASDGSGAKSTVTVNITSKYSTAVFEPINSTSGADIGYKLYTKKKSEGGVPLDYVTFSLTGSDKLILDYSSSVTGQGGTFYSVYNPKMRKDGAVTTTTKTYEDFKALSSEAKVNFVKTYGEKALLSAKINDGSGVTVSKDFYVCTIYESSTSKNIKQINLYTFY